MNKYVYIIPNVTTAHNTVSQLKELGIAEEQISIAAEQSVSLDDLPELDYEESNDMLPGLKRGAGIGGATGLLAGLAATVITPAGIVVGGAALVVATTVAGALLFPACSRVDQMTHHWR